MRGIRVVAGAVIGAALSASAARAAFTTFESGHVRPLAMSPDGTRLFAVNTPDNHLEVFAVSVGSGALTHEASVPVGLEPVAVAARSNTEVWVVNHLSDSVSVVDLGTAPPRVVRTLLVGDEPRDVVFAGTGGTRAFVTAAHRGQNRPGDPQLTTPGIGRADVWVFDATSPGPTSLGGAPLAILTLFTDTPRALAVSPDGGTVYAAGFHTGNRTTAISEGAVCDGGAGAPACSVFGATMPGGLPAPNVNLQSIIAPETGLIVRFDAATGRWEDELGRNWNNAVRFALPDRDVFAIDANNLAATPASFAGVGTVLFNMVANPVSGKVYVSNTEARNEVRFEGPGLAASTVRGHLHEARITVLDGAAVLPRHLNPHIDYGVVPSPPGVKEASLATPLGMAVTSDGATLYVAAFGSSRVGVFDITELETDGFTPSAADHIPVTGGGPSGLVLNEAAGRLYVFTRFDNAISVVDTTTASEIAHLPVHNPEPAAVVDGRPVLYDARLSSSNGEASCAGCHVFADFDSLAWDLGNPDDVLLNNPNPFEVGSGTPFHPMKGPMATQSLRGLANHGPMHWRGDRTGGNDPGGNALDEHAAFGKFIGAFDGLLGRGAPIGMAEMAAFTDFILQVTYPPNPIRALDDSLTPAQQAGRDLFFGPITDGVRNCDGCHVTNPAAGFFGGNGRSSIEGEPQEFKIPHLRNMYQKVGMFGMPAVPFFRLGDNGHKGDQVRGFGFLHDGSVDTLFRFHGATAFSFGAPEAANLERFMLAFDSNLKPVVGQQVTLTSANAVAAGPRIGLLIAQAATGACELTVKGVLGGEQRGWLRLPGGSFQSDRSGEPSLSDAQLRAHATTPGQQRTYLCVPPGSGARVGIDRDGDGFLDRDELDAGSDPADPSSTPPGGTTTTTVSTTTTTTSTTRPPSQVFVPIPTTKLTMKDRSLPPADPNRRKVAFKSDTRTAAPNRIVPPFQGSPDDPRVVGAIIAVYNSVGPGGELMAVGLPAVGWTATGPNAYKYKGAATAAITGATFKADQIAFKGGKGLWNYTLNEPAQGRVAAVFIVGGTVYCSDAPAKGFDNPQAVAKNDRRDKFVAQPKTPAPLFCVAP